jgi:hypothetical protein
MLDEVARNELFGSSSVVSVVGIRAGRSAGSSRVELCTCMSLCVCVCVCVYACCKPEKLFAEVSRLLQTENICQIYKGAYIRCAACVLMTCAKRTTQEGEVRMPAV